MNKDAPTTSQQRIAEKLSVIEDREKGQKADTQKEQEKEVERPAMEENGVNSGARMSVKIKRRYQNGLKNLQIKQVRERKLKTDPITAQRPFK